MTKSPPTAVTCAVCLKCGFLNKTNAKRCLNCFISVAGAPQITLPRKFNNHERSRYMKVSSADRQALLREVGVEGDLSFLTGSKSPLLGANFNEQMVCPHCQVKGRIRTQKAKVKTGVSGGKATGAILTLGASLLVTGLSQKRRVTQATCDNCQMTWAIG